MLLDRPFLLSPQLPDVALLQLVLLLLLNLIPLCDLPLLALKLVNLLFSLKLTRKVLNNFCLLRQLRLWNHLLGGEQRLHRSVRFLVTSGQGDYVG